MVILRLRLHVCTDERCDARMHLSVAELDRLLVGFSLRNIAIQKAK